MITFIDLKGFLHGAVDCAVSSCRQVAAVMLLFTTWCNQDQEGLPSVSMLDKVIYQIQAYGYTAFYLCSCTSDAARQLISGSSDQIEGAHSRQACGPYFPLVSNTLLCTSMAYAWICQQAKRCCCHRKSTFAANLAMDGGLYWLHEQKWWLHIATSTIHFTGITYQHPQELPSLHADQVKG